MVEKNDVFIDCPVTFSLQDRNARGKTGGKASARIEKETLSLLPESGQSLSFSLRDIEEICAQDYQVQLDLLSQERLFLSHLGYRFEDFVRTLHQYRNELILKDMLAQEVIRQEDVPAEVEYLAPDGSRLLEGKCKARLYETSLAIMPEQGEIVRVPLGYMEEVQSADYRLLVSGDSGEKIVFSKLGSQFDPFNKIMSRTLNDLSLKTQSFLKDLLPQADPLSIRSASRLMKDGRAAAKRDIEAISPALWIEMEKQLLAAPIGDEFEFLRSLGQEDHIALGFKKGLMGDLSGDTIWFLVPIYSADPQAPGNAVAMEAGAIYPHDSSEDVPESGDEEQVIKQAGRASYFFRIVSRKDYPNLRHSSELDRMVEQFISDFNRSMLAVNFRREPIYLPDEKLDEPAYQKYRFSLRRLPALRMLRSHFIGRVLHRSQQQWQKDVLDLLKFNIHCQDDDKKWGKGG